VPRWHSAASIGAPTPPLLRLPPDDPRHWITHDDLTVRPDLLGLPLGRPGQRLRAMLIDLAVLGLLTSMLNGWLLAATTVVLGGHGWAQLRPGRPRRRGMAWVLAGLLLPAGLQADMPWQARHDHAAVGAASDPDNDGTLPRTIPAMAAPLAAAPGAPPSAASATAPGTDAAVATLAARVAQLEAELAQARQRADGGQARARAACGRTHRQADDCDAGIQALWRRCRRDGHWRGGPAATAVGPQPPGDPGQDRPRGGGGPAAPARAGWPRYCVASDESTTAIASFSSSPARALHWSTVALATLP
jgi:hypothetical protein